MKDWQTVLPSPHAKRGHLLDKDTGWEEKITESRIWIRRAAKNEILIPGCPQVEPRNATDGMDALSGKLGDDGVGNLSLFQRKGFPSIVVQRGKFFSAEVAERPGERVVRCPMTGSSLVCSQPLAARHWGDRAR